MADARARPSTCRDWGNRFLVLVLAAGLALGAGAAAEESSSPPPGAEASAAVPAASALADLLPRAAELSPRLAELEKTLAEVLDEEAARKTIEEQRSQVGAFEERLEVLKTSRAYGYDQVADLRASLRRGADELSGVNQSVSAALARVEGLRREWSEEKERWDRWQEDLPEEVPLDTVMPTALEAQRSIETALGAVGKAVEQILAVQSAAGEVRTRVRNLMAEADRLLQVIRGDVFRKSAVTMLSPIFYAQFDAELRAELGRALRTIPWPDRGFFASQGWVVLLQIVLSVGLALAILRHRKAMGLTARWEFLGRRPLAAALLAGVSFPVALYSQVPPAWALVLWAAAGISAARLLAGVITRPWKRRILYLLATLFLLTHFLRVLSIPLPVFRVYVVLVALGGVPLCLWRARVNVRRGDNPLYIWALRLGAALLAVVFVAQILGYTALAAHLLQASIQSTFLILLAWMLALLARGAVGFLLSDQALGQLSGLRPISGVVARRADFLIGALVVTLAAAFLLEVWRLFDSPLEALRYLFSLGVHVGEQRVTVGLVLAALAIFFGAYASSLAAQAALMEHVYPQRHVQRGVRLSMNRLVHYAFILVGFFAAVSFLGVDLQTLTLLAGAFGIGIGFGLQNIVNNFVSGLILLFERPIKVGDLVQLGDQWGRIEKMGLRATVVQTVDQSEVIVPNSDLISQPVTNWTLSDRNTRLLVPVGIAYGSDVPLAMGILEEVAVEHPLVLEDPAPQVFFLEFGESSLQMELRVWVANIDKRFEVRSELNQAVDRRFREAGVEIAFPQRDLHLRTVDERAREALGSVVSGVAVPDVGKGGPGDSKG